MGQLCGSLWQAPAVAMRQGGGTKAPNAADLARGIREQSLTVRVYRVGWVSSLVAVQRRSRYEVLTKSSSEKPLPVSR